MIFINLLPDIKIEHLKMLRLRRTLVSLAIIVFAVCTALCVVFFFLARNSEQAVADTENASDKLLTDNVVAEDITKLLNLKYRVDIVKMLHEYKTDPERLLVDIAYLEQLIPEDSNYTEIDFDFVKKTFFIEGATKDIDTAAKLEKTIQYAGYEACKPENAEDRYYLFYIDPESPLKYDDNPDDNEAEGSYEVGGMFAGILFDSRIEKPKPIVIPPQYVDQATVVQPGALCLDNLKLLGEKNDQGGYERWDEYLGGQPGAQEFFDPTAENKDNSGEGAE